MPDLFDNFFGKINTKINGGKTTYHYGGANPPNTGSFYSYHSTANNNNYWLPKAKQDDDKIVIEAKERQSSITSINSETLEGGRSRFSSVSSEKGT
ncbi:uncharacterized protein RJT21DRAFT_50359 [Scheffersomyces amazonensis]|uniref:uncharacterized protein n=1 Tax=Scheffersomyces amazonensis TaxID=1078765 RepID=UPI00315D5AD2